MTSRSIAIGAGLLALLGGGLWLSLGGCHVDTEVTKPYAQRSLATEEIRAMLASGDFKQRLEASRQVDKLEPQERLTVLLELAQDPDAAARLLAVKKLKEVDDPRARETLTKMAKDDPDPNVRELAAAGS